MSTSTWDQIAAERRVTLDLLRELSDDELATPSLCDGWTVKDVIGHIIWVATTRPPEVVNEVLLGGFKIGKVMANSARVIGSLPTDVLIDRLSKAVDSTIIMPTMKPMSYLADTMVHNQDMFRPLGRERTIDPDALWAALSYYHAENRFVKGRRRTKGVTLVATDLDKKLGDGPIVSGTAEALLMVTTGRSAALADLEGDGVSILRGRM